MRIIFEGIDGSGKTTAVKKAVKYLDMPTFWPAGPPGNILKLRACCEYQLSLNNTIFDRVTCISERCYNILLSKQRLMLLNTYLNLMLRDSVVIYCVAQSEEAADGLRNDKHDKFVRDNFNGINLRYINIMRQIPHFTYDFKRDCLKELMSNIKERIY